MTDHLSPITGEPIKPLAYPLSVDRKVVIDQHGRWVFGWLHFSTSEQEAARLVDDMNESERRRSGTNDPAAASQRESGEVQCLQHTRCPRCNCTLIQRDGKVWCSFIGGENEKACAYGIDAPRCLVPEPGAHPGSFTLIPQPDPVAAPVRTPIRTLPPGHNGCACPPAEPAPASLRVVKAQACGPVPFWNLLDADGMIQATVWDEALAHRIAVMPRLSEDAREIIDICFDFYEATGQEQTYFNESMERILEAKIELKALENS